MLKRFICLKNVIILSICISWNNSFMLSTWKQLFLTCAKSPHSKRKWRTVNSASQPTHCGCSSPCSKYEWVTLVWPKRSRAKTTSSLLMFRTTDWHSPIVGLMSRSLFPMLLFHEVCHSSKIYLLIDGLKLENGILKEVGSNESDVFACLSTISFPWIPIWLGIQQRANFYKLKAHDVFLKVSESVDSMNWYGSLYNNDSPTIWLKGISN